MVVVEQKSRRGKGKASTMGVANALVFLIAVIIGIVVGVAVFYGAMEQYTGAAGGIL